jgi:methionyl-tRNA formyltransferase
MSLKILFMGTPHFAVPILKAIFNSHHKILAVYSQPPKKKSRGQKIIESPIHALAEKLDIQVRCPETLNSEKEFNFIKKLAPDIAVVVAYGQIIPKDILNIENIDFINIHASLLPKLRGAAPIQRSIMKMHKETGISIMKIVKKLDAGPYMMQESIKIASDINNEKLGKSLSLLASELIIKSLNLLENKKEKFVEQDEQKVTYAKKIEKSECRIKWNLPAKELVAKINGLSPFPGAWFEHKKNRLKIIKAEETNLKGNIGEVINNNLIIGCLDKSIKITQIQKEGKKTLNTNEFIAGYSIKKGEKLD